MPSAALSQGAMVVARPRPADQDAPMGVTGNASFERAKAGVLRKLYDRSDDAALVLAHVYEGARAVVAPIAETIATAMPGYTDHSIDHLDGLWDNVALLNGEEPLDPAEAFVLGGAILLHDLAMTPAAYPGGFPGPDGELELRDLVAAALRRDLERAPTPEEIESCSPTVSATAVQAFLRRHHAEVAHTIAVRDLVTGSTEEGEDFVFGDRLLREHYGDAIGTIAESHWWDHDRLERELAGRPSLAAPARHPDVGTVDLLRLACLLRCADAAHLDERRAERVRRRIQQPAGASIEHWDFQGAATARPQVVGGKVVFQAPRGFTIDDAPAWWLAYQMLRQVDHELRSCHDLLDRSGRRSLRASAVDGIESPDRFADVFRTFGWRPIDAEIRVADARRLIELLGGEQLYGSRPNVALRELVQNARDAIAARRAFDPAMPEGTITVRFEIAGDTTTVVVSDNGVGMRQRTVTDRLLVLGSSYWASEDALEDLPGLASSDFEPVGHFGIGFFSVSMVAEKVEVVTRHVDAAADETVILQMDDAFAGMPVLREARRDERRRHAGTEVRLTMPTTTTDAILGERWATLLTDEPTSPPEIAIRRLFPMLDCRLDVELPHHAFTHEADSWLTAPDRVLSDLSGRGRVLPGLAVTIHDETGDPMGRVSVDPSEFSHSRLLLATGGIAVTSIDLRPLVGVARGHSVDLARARARLDLPARAVEDIRIGLASWLERHDATLDDDDRSVVHRVLAAVTSGSVHPFLFVHGIGFVGLDAALAALTARWLCVLELGQRPNAQQEPSAWAGGEVLVRAAGHEVNDPAWIRRPVDVVAHYSDSLLQQPGSPSQPWGIEIVEDGALPALPEVMVRLVAAALEAGGRIEPLLDAVRPIEAIRRVLLNAHHPSGRGPLPPEIAELGRLDRPTMSHVLTWAADDAARVEPDPSRDGHLGLMGAQGVPTEAVEALIEDADSILGRWLASACLEDRSRIGAGLALDDDRLVGEGHVLYPPRRGKDASNPTRWPGHRATIIDRERLLDVLHGRVDPAALHEEDEPDEES